MDGVRAGSGGCKKLSFRIYIPVELNERNQSWKLFHNKIIIMTQKNFPCSSCFLKVSLWREALQSMCATGAYSKKSRIQISWSQD